MTYGSIPQWNSNYSLSDNLIVIQLMKYYSASPHLTLMIHVGWVKLAMKLPYWGKNHPFTNDFRVPFGYHQWGFAAARGWNVPRIIRRSLSRRSRAKKKGGRWSRFEPEKTCFFWWFLMVLLCFWYVFVGPKHLEIIRVFRWVSQLRPRSGAMFEIRKVWNAVIPRYSQCLSILSKGPEKAWLRSIWRARIKDLKRLYHLVMTNSSPWKITIFKYF